MTNVWYEIILENRAKVVQQILTEHSIKSGDLQKCKTVLTILLTEVLFSFRKQLPFLNII